MGVPVTIEAVHEPLLEAPVDAARPSARASETPPRRPSRAPHWNVAAVASVGVLLTALLVLGTRSVHNSNENRLLRQRAREVSTVTAASLPTVQTPLASAAVLAEATNGDAASFQNFMAPIISAGRPFISMSLWSANTAGARLLVVVGQQPELATESPTQIAQFFARAKGANTLTINNLLGASDRRLGYALTASSPEPRFVVYGEAALPKNRQAAIAKDSAFADLGYALYLGDSADDQYLLASSTGGAVLHGRTAAEVVPFGDSKLLVVLTPHTELGGTLLARLWWILGGLGLLLTIGGASLVERLTRRRRDAETLAAENARLYAQQRSVAQTLQHSLLAETFPEVRGVEFGAKYVAGEEGMDIGGDWYDVVRLERDNILVVVGDVSGRGLEASTMMAALRYAVRAYAAEGHSPALILSKLSSLVSIGRDGHFATVLCGLIDVSGRRMTIANAGHPEPLLVTPTGAEFVTTSVGVPVGVREFQPYTEVEVPIPRGSTLLLYTDGAIERRGERLDVGVQRLKEACRGTHGTVEEFLQVIVNGVMAGTEDDTALLAVRWRN